MSDIRYTIGIDFGGTSIKLALVQFNHHSFKIISFSSLPTREYNRTTLIEQLIIRILRLKAEAIFKDYKIRGVGIGVPGQVNFSTGLVFKLTNVPGWKNVLLKKELQENINFPVTVDNDANLVALAESKFGAARGFKNCICITLGTGIGGGLILNGRIYRGMNFTAGEIGHMTINENGPECACGNIGCAERYVGNRYILEEARRRLSRGQKSKINSIVKGNYSKLTLEMLSEAAKAKDKFAIMLWQDIGKHLGVLLANVVNLLNPEIIVIGGGVAGAGGVLLDALRKTVRARALKAACTNLKIVHSKFKNKAGIIGAATLALQYRGKK